jgi:drug/metabolite transporter superfamily protein YnfA
VDKHWLLNRHDPRTLLAVSIGVLLIGLVAAVSFVRAGGWLAAFGGLWVMTALAQVVYSAVRVLTLRRADGGEPGSPDAGSVPRAW